MKILITTGIFPPEIGGPATYTYDLSQKSKIKNQKYTVITFTQNPKQIDGVKIISVDQQWNKATRQIKLFQNILREAKDADIIYAQDPLVVGLTSVLAGKLIGKKVIVRYGGDPAWEAAFSRGKTKEMLVEFLRHPNLDVFLTRLSFLLVDRIITNSEFLKMVIHDVYRINARKITLINNAMETRAFADKRQTKKKVFTVLSFGRLVSWKKYDEIIEAVDKINKRGKIKVKLTIFGDGPERNNLEKMGKEFLQLLPSKNHQEALFFLRRADIYVLNSLYEGSPNQVIEAFSVGTPVVATDIPGTDEVAMNNKTALTVKPGDIEGLSLAIEKVLTDTLLARKLVAGGRKMVDKFTWETHLTQLYNVFDDCLTSRSNGS